MLSVSEGNRMDKLAYLAQINLLDSLPPDELREIGRMASMQAVPKGTLLLDPSRPRRVLYMLKRGYVQLRRITPDGRELIVGLLGPGNIFGEIDALSMGTRHTYAEAMTDVIICSLRDSDFMALLERHPPIATRMIRILSDRLRELEELVEKLALGDVRTRLLYLLVKLGSTFGVDDGDFVRLDVGLTHEDLAHMVGSTRETVSVVLGELTRAGVVRKGRRRLWVHLARARALLEDGTR